jgi:hypothetical protein
MAAGPPDNPPWSCWLKGLRPLIRLPGEMLIEQQKRKDAEALRLMTHTSLLGSQDSWSLLEHADTRVSTVEYQASTVQRYTYTGIKHSDTNVGCLRTRSGTG